MQDFKYTCERKVLISLIQIKFLKKKININGVCISGY